MFCPNCGMNQPDGSRFCQNCGTPFAGAPYTAQPPVYMAVKPKIPGRGMGIAAMVLGIIGLVYGFYFFIGMAAISEINEFGGIGGIMAVYCLMFSSMSIMGIAFGTNAINKGYVNNISKSGRILGIIGVIFYGLAFILAIA